MNRKIKTIIGGGVLAGAMAIGSVAGAAVIFDPATGTGFVGKGDVQLAIGWNNKQLQDNAADVTFAYNDVVSYEWFCYRETTTGGPEPKVVPHTNERARSQAVDGDVNADPRQKKGQSQFTGFTLNGWDGDPDLGAFEGPALGSCPNDGIVIDQAAYEADGSIVKVDIEDLAPTLSGGGLVAIYDGVSYSL